MTKVTVSGRLSKSVLWNKKKGLAHLLLKYEGLLQGLITSLTISEKTHYYYYYYLLSVKQIRCLLARTQKYNSSLAFCIGFGEVINEADNTFYRCFRGIRPPGARTVMERLDCWYKTCSWWFLCTVMALALQRWERTYLVVGLPPLWSPLSPFLRSTFMQAHLFPFGRQGHWR